MGKLYVRHYLDIYQTRLEMQEEGITNPTQEVKVFVRELVAKLSKMPLDEEVILLENSMVDSQENVIADFPWK